MRINNEFTKRSHQPYGKKEFAIRIRAKARKQKHVSL
jgi:hypothetical protein